MSEPMSEKRLEEINRRPLTDPPDPYSQGWIDAWSVAHSAAQCGHARANWKDPKFGTPEYDGDERCEVCSEVRRLRERERVLHGAVRATYAEMNGIVRFGA